MVNQQLLDYIKQQLQQGISQEQIRSSLMANGWQEADINEAFSSMNYPSSSTPPDNIAAQQFSTTSQQPARRINKTLLAVISILGILIIGGGVSGYFYYFRETPEKVIEKMTTRLTEVKTLEHQGEIKAEITTPDLLGGFNFMQPVQQTPSEKASNFSINFSGKRDIGDLNNLKELCTFNIRTDALKELTQEESVFGSEVRIIDKVVYVNLNNLPNLEFFDLSLLSNQWIKIDTEVIKNQLGLENFEEQIKEAQKQQELTPEQVEKIKQIVEQAKVFKITEKLTSENIEGVSTHHYKFLIDKNELKKLIVDIIKIVDIGKVVLDKTLTDEELAEFDKEFDKGLEVIKTLDGEIWIGKKDYLPYKILLTLEIEETAESETAGRLTTTMSFKNYNKLVQIDTPSPVKNIEEVLTQLFSEFLGSMQLPEYQPNLQLPTR